MQKINYFKKRSIREIRGGPTARGWHDWRWQLAGSFAGVAGLAALEPLLPGMAKGAAAAAEKYPFCVTPYYLSLCDLDDRRDPVLRQILPDRRETADAKSLPDPLGESSFEPVPGLIHRYRNRAVVIVTANCAVRCRHCTRKNTLLSFADFQCRGRSSERRLFPLSNCPDSISQRLPAIIRYLRLHPEIREVIISGGDPLLLGTPEIDRILGGIRAVKSVEVLRIGTRAPVVLPMRVDRALCECLKQHRPLWINTQFNHPREITPEAEKACRMLQEAGLPVSNQAVLMRGVNDSLPVLAALCNGLQRIMVRPYYVFQCDRVRGTNHFKVPAGKAVNLSRRLRERLGGLSMPLFVADIPGRKSKIPLEADCCFSGMRSSI
jgi:lysine 2,3-aminomutase